MFNLLDYAKVLLFSLFLTVCSFGQRSTPTPTPTPAPPALTSVSVDATLIGDGRPTSPLGVADGAISTTKLADNSVTASKIATENAPANSLILMSTGGGMRWEPLPITPPSGGGGPMRVVDSTSRTVGYVVSVNPNGQFTFVVSHIEIPSIGFDEWVGFYVNKNGITGSDERFIYYSGSGCSGNMYVDSFNGADDQWLVRKGYKFPWSSNLFIPYGPITTRGYGSYRRNTLPGNCENGSSTNLLQAVTTIAESTLGVPPFGMTR